MPSTLRGLVRYLETKWPASNFTQALSFLSFYSLQLCRYNIRGDMCFFKKILLEEPLIYNAVLISGVIQQSDSVIDIHIFILFQMLCPSRLLENTE